MQIATVLFTFAAQKYIYPSVIIRMRILKVRVNGPVPKGEGGGGAIEAIENRGRSTGLYPKCGAR